MLQALVLAVSTFANLPLDQAQARALAASPDVAIARGKVAEEQALFEQARAAFGPALVGNYVEGPQGAAEGTVAQRLTTLGASITLGDLIAYSPAVAQANANLRAAAFDFANAQRTERINVIHLYFGALSANATLTARRQALASAQAQERAAQLRYGAGDAPHLDVVRAAVARAQAEAALATAQADQRNAYAALETETGVGDGELAALAEQSAPGPLATPDVSKSLDAALARRPEIASAQSNVAAEEHAVSVARRGGLPVVTLTGGFTSGVDSGFKTSGPSATASVSLPVGGGAHARVLAEEARLAQARAQLEKARREVTNEVTAAVRTFAAQSSALDAARRAFSEASMELQATQTGYRNGASSSLDVESARATYTQALVDQISATYAKAEAQATLQLLMGM
ncbi:MAG TPA: TolC family protein [Candidatus Baltobacteraceae bacterium]|jgi:outer membrane protein TolC|nr:TolC family protein [Candidatus Baltobacteraceae bacterium]